MPRWAVLLTVGGGLMIIGLAMIGWLWYNDQVRNVNQPTLTEGEGVGVIGVIAAVIGFALAVAGGVAAII